MRTTSAKFACLVFIATLCVVAGCADPEPANTAEGLSPDDVAAYDEMVKEDFDPSDESE